MKLPSNKIESPYVYIVSFIVALPICAVIWSTKKVVWPLMRIFTNKILWPLMRYIAIDLVRNIKNYITKTEETEQTEQLPTPEIFKDAPNLGRAREIQLDN
ncbi:hypothetical protein [Janthinobacterium sp. Ant5-2-1]|uniref:hypothetical protein n=1 Tax=Janthinobacterium sp. Ant5-2-1 TaxID=1755239 RepID=UPI000717EA4D|nr:hypothetical protein [Janthinobacterium sp. Ant5-2-1]